MCNRKNKNILKLKFKIFKYNKFFLNRRFRYMIVNNSRLFFLKKFIFFCFSYKKSVYFLNGICLISGKYNASISPYIFRRNTIKYLLNYNFIPNVIKKYK